MRTLLGLAARVIRLAGRGGALRRLGAVSAIFLLSTVLVGAALLLARTTAVWSHPPGGGSHLVVYLVSGTDAIQSRALANDLASLGGALGVEVVSPADTLSRLRIALAGEQSLLEGIEPESMPASIEVSLAPGVEEVLPLSPAIASLRRHPAVEQVAVQAANPDRLTAATAAMAPWARALAALLAVVAGLLGFTVTRWAWTLPRGELAVARLLGAGWSYHVLPTAIAAATAAALGALVGVAGLLAAGWYMSAKTAGVLTLGGSPVLLLTLDAAMFVVIAALVAGTAGARAAMSRDSADG